MYHAEVHTLTHELNHKWDKTSFTFRPAPPVQTEMGIDGPISFEWGNGKYIISQIVRRWLKPTSILGIGQRQWMEVETTASVNAIIFFDNRSATWHLAELKTPFAPPPSRPRRLPRQSVLLD